MRKLLPLCATAAALIAMPAALRAMTLKIFPVLVTLSPAEPVQTMTIENSSDAPSRVQVRVLAWRQEGGQDVFSETRDVLANPGLFEVAPGGTQIIRFGNRVAPQSAERSYRVFLEEVPSGRPRAPGEVQTLLRVSIPIFVPGTSTTGKLDWRAWPSGDRKVMVAIRNEGSTHVHFNRFGLARGGRTLGGQAMSVYLLPGADTQVELDVNAPVRAGDALKLDAIAGEAKLSADLVSQAGPHETGHS